MKSKIMLSIQLIFILGLLGKLEAADPTTNPPLNNKVFSLGLGIDTGILGFKYEYWLKDKPVILGLGLGLEGIIPQAQLVLYRRGNISLFAQTSLLYSPFEFLLFEKNTLAIMGGGGIQYWPLMKAKNRFYLSLSGSMGYIVLGKAEGNKKLFGGPNFQVGFVF